MSMSEDTDVAVDTNTDVEEATNSNESGNEKDTTDLLAELEKQRKANLEIAIRAKKAEAELKLLKRSKLETSEEPDREIVKSVKRLEEIENKRQFGFENNLSPEETDFMFRATGGKPTKESLEDPFIKGGLESYRSKKRLEANTPSSSSSSSPFRSKPFKEMTEEERKRAFEEKSPLNKR